MHPLPGPLPLHELFDRQADQTPDALAVVDGPLCLTYRELQQQSLSVAHHLLQAGLRPEDPVGLLAGRSAAMVVATLGILRAGGCYVPIDPALPEARRRFIVEDTGLRQLLSEPGQTALPPLPEVASHCLQAVLAAQAADPPLPQVPAQALAYVMYTSGSTGVPKGVLVTHANVANLAKDSGFVALHPGDRLLLTGAIGFDANTFELWGALLNGLCLHLVDEATLIDARRLGPVLQAQHITTLLMTTALCSRLAKQDATIFAPLRQLLVGGDAMSPSLAATLRRAAPGLRLVNVYGPTENTTFSTAYVVEGDEPGGVPIGLPLRGTTARIVDDAGRPVAPGEVGELLVGGAHVARGYLNRPALTRERFIEVEGLGRCYRTGDLARYRADGQIEFIGRRDRQLKLNGYRIEPGEIEAALCAVDGVLDVATRVWERDGEKFMAAYYLGRHDAPGEPALRQRLARHLPPYLLPAFLVELPSFPLDAHGKVDHAALPSPFDATGPGPTAGGEAGGEDTRTHQAIAEIWQEVLGVERIEADADFFALGGTSIKAIGILGRMTAAGMQVSLSDILSHRTLGALSAWVATAQRTVRPGGAAASLGERLTAAFPGSRFTLRRYTVAPQGHQPATELRVLHCDGTPVDRARLRAWLAAEVPPEQAPHHLGGPAPGHAGVTAGPISAEALRRLLGLRSFADLQPQVLIDHLALDRRANDMRLRAARVLAEYPFSPVQQLQYSFRTPPSLGHFRLQEVLDPERLRHAFQHLLQEHGLLRALPFEQAGRHWWREHDSTAGLSVEPTLLDLSDHLLSDEQFEQLGRGLIEAVRFDTAQGLLYQVVVLSRHLAEHVVVLCFHHVLFDRVSEEALQRGLLARYRDLQAGRMPRSRGTPAFARYVEQLHRGPLGVSPQEVIERYELQAFHAAKQQILHGGRSRPLDHSCSFELAAPLPAFEAGCSLGLALDRYVRALHAAFGLDAVPVLFIYDGRRYDGQDYYDVVGELIDYVPLLLRPGTPPQQLQRQAEERLALASRHNINFLNLVNNPELEPAWLPVRRLIDAGPGYAHIDLCMFNFLGNQPGPGSWREHHQEEVRRGPNPLPIHSFLNCIAVSYRDGFIFQLRSSYEPQVAALRQAMLQPPHAG